VCINPSEPKRSAIANSLAACFPVTLNAAAVRRHAVKMEWQAVDRAREERKGAEIYAPTAFDDELHASSTLPARTKAQGLQSFSGLAERLGSHKRRGCP
jgi:hypothetical protein